jgi:hypothetical protein
MSASKSFAAAASVALLTIALAAASACAQGGGSNPSGGTSAEPTVMIPTVYAAPSTGSTGEVSLGSSLRGWFLNLRISRQVAYFRTSSLQGRTHVVAIQKRLWER